MRMRMRMRVCLSFVASMRSIINHPSSPSSSSFSSSVFFMTMHAHHPNQLINTSQGERAI
jgi:hypothetical protein